MSKVWRFTGPPENWITAIRLSTWALNDNNIGLWENKIETGDIVIFHSTKKSEFNKKSTSSVIGFGFVGDNLHKKKEFWWLQELRDSKNYWPYVVPFDEIYIFSDCVNIDFDRQLNNKSNTQIEKEINILLKNSVKISELTLEAKNFNNNNPGFPVNGSASGVNLIYEKLILDNDKSIHSFTKKPDSQLLDRKIEEKIDEELSDLSKIQLFHDAQNFDNRNEVSHVFKTGKLKLRKENQTQKRRIAKIEDYSCQVCSFKSQYTRTNGKPGWIVHVDHIIDKSKRGDESLGNLWVLCPNCHAKKTYGIIKIDPIAKKVYENDVEISIIDNHLFI